MLTTNLQRLKTFSKKENALTVKNLYAMMEKVKKLNRKNLKLLAKELKMKDYNVDSFWNDFTRMKDEKYPNPTYITQYKARYDHGFTDYVLKTLQKDNLVRTDNGNPPKFALEDLFLLKKIRQSVNK